MEHPYVDKTEFQRLQDDNLDLAQQLQNTKKENSSLRVIIQLLQEDKTGLAQIHLFSLPMGIVGMPHELREENIGLRSQVQNLQQEIDKQNNELQGEMQKLRDEDNNKSIQITQLQ